MQGETKSVHNNALQLKKKLRKKKN